MESKQLNHDVYVPHEAQVVEYVRNKEDIFTLKLKFTDNAVLEQYSFKPGQFNMLYLYGVGEVAISIVNDEQYRQGYVTHIIQVVGRITKGMAKLKPGDTIGLRGPFGTTWPVDEVKGKDIIIATGGLGNAPLMALVEEILKRRNEFGKLYVLHGIRDYDLLICEDMYLRWNQAKNTEVLIATSHSEPSPHAKFRTIKGFVTDFIPSLNVDYSNTVVMSVGPEIMMKLVAKKFAEIGVAEENIYLSLERSMKCAIGHCGHCQLGADFVCKDGPVYPYTKCKHLLSLEGL